MRSRVLNTGHRRDPGSFRITHLYLKCFLLGWTLDRVREPPHPIMMHFVNAWSMPEARVVQSPLTRYRTIPCDGTTARMVLRVFVDSPVHKFVME